MNIRFGDVCRYVELGYGYFSLGKRSGLGYLRIIRVEVVFKFMSWDEIIVGIWEV